MSGFIDEPVLPMVLSEGAGRRAALTLPSGVDELVMPAVVAVAEVDIERGERMGCVGGCCCCDGGGGGGAANVSSTSGDTGGDGEGSGLESAESGVDAMAGDVVYLIAGGGQEDDQR